VSLLPQSGRLQVIPSRGMSKIYAVQTRISKLEIRNKFECSKYK
jgi:hypothetical protein